MATATVACPKCSVDGLAYLDSFDYDELVYLPGVLIKWEHSCPRFVYTVSDGQAVPVVDSDGNTYAQPPYVGLFMVPESNQQGA